MGYPSGQEKVLFTTSPQRTTTDCEIMSGFLVVLVMRLVASCYEIAVHLLSPDSDENEIFLYIITTCSNIQVMGIKEVDHQE